MGDSVLNTIQQVNLWIGILFGAFFFYQIVYLLIPYVKKRKPHQSVSFHRFGVLIAARNEEAVIGQLIESILNQDYPRELIDIYVVADNCTDQTANRAWEAGAVVKERFNQWLVGKGYALHWLLNELRGEGQWENHDAWLVLDADNLLDEHYITEMNRTLSDGYDIATSYRNSKNFGDNWISAGYSTWFLREAKYLNDARMRLGASCAVSGTGFYFSKRILKKYDGWNFFLLTEDIQFSIQCAVDGEQIGYSENAILYDEQPTSFRQSWRQRLRWSKGNIQVMSHYTRGLLRGIFKNHRFASYDLFMNLVPPILLTGFSTVINLFAWGYGVCLGEEQELLLLGKIMMGALCGGYVTMYLMGLITTVSEWKRIHCNTWKKILYTFTFPLYLATSVPILLTAMFKKVEWLPITHNAVKTLSGVRGVGKAS